MNLCPYETHDTIRLHREALLREAERERLLDAGQPRRAPMARLIVRTARLLAALGIRLEARHTTET